MKRSACQICLPLWTTVSIEITPLICRIAKAHSNAIAETTHARKSAKSRSRSKSRCSTRSPHASRPHPGIQRRVISLSATPAAFVGSRARTTTRGSRRWKSGQTLTCPLFHRRYCDGDCHFEGTLHHYRAGVASFSTIKWLPFRSSNGPLFA